MQDGPSKKKQALLLSRMQELAINADDLEESFTMGSGKGGQKQNKTSNAVQLKHRPTGLIVTCQHSRSRELNRYLARKILCEKLDHYLNPKTSQLAQVIEKIRKQKKKRKKRAEHPKKGSEKSKNGGTL